MKPNNKLNQALKDALFEHAEPLHEGQWERLRAELEEKKKRRFLPWFFLFAGACLSAGLIYSYIYSSSNKTAAHEQVANNQTNSHASDQNVADGKSNELPAADLNIPTSRSAELAMKPEPNSTEISHHASQSPDNLYSPTVQQSIDDGHAPTLENWDLWSSHALKAQVKEYNSILNKNSNRGNEGSINSSPKTTLVATDVNTSNKQLKQADADNAITSTEAETNKDTAKKNDSTKGPGDEMKKVKWVFGLHTGFAGVNSVVTGTTNSDRLHKDSKNLFRMGNDNQSAMFYNFNIEYRFSQKIGLRLNTGLQYRLLTNKVNFTYKLSQIPVRMPDNTISTYITIPDTSNPLLISVRENQSFSFLTIPIGLNYSVAIRKRSELLIGAGVNVTALVGSTGSSFSLNELSYKQAGDMIKYPFHFGINASLGYSRQVYRQWWLGAELGIQSMSMRYDLGYGDLKSRMNSRAIGIHISYKLLN